jgi:stringent starvation protein B
MGKLFSILPRAVGNLELANDEVRFNARFGGVPRNVSVPMAAVLAVYARENGAGPCSNRKRPMMKMSLA